MVHAQQPSVVKMFSKMQNYKGRLFKSQCNVLNSSNIFLYCSGLKIYRLLRITSNFFAAGGSKNLKLTQAIVKMIIIDNLPISFVEGFKNLMKEHSPLYKVSTRNTIKAHIDSLYEAEVKKFVDFLKNPYLSLISDIWTDSQMNSMLGVIVHGLAKNSMFSATIGVFKLTEAHTAAYIFDVLAQVLTDYEINSDKIVAFVTDNGANIVKALGEQFGKHKHVPCFVHTLNLVCENSLDVPEMKDLIRKCRNIVT